MFLAERAIVLTPEARDRFLGIVVGEYATAVRLLERRAEGNYSPDKHPTKFPALQRPAGMTCWRLFERRISGTVAQRTHNAAPNCQSRCEAIDAREAFLGMRDLPPPEIDTQTRQITRSFLPYSATSTLSDQRAWHRR
jgi:hypothetical protein